MMSHSLLIIILCKHMQYAVCNVSALLSALYLYVKYLCVFSISCFYANFGYFSSFFPYKQMAVLLAQSMNDTKICIRRNEKTKILIWNLCIDTMRTEWWFSSGKTAWLDGLVWVPFSFSFSHSLDMTWIDVGKPFCEFDANMQTKTQTNKKPQSEQTNPILKLFIFDWTSTETLKMKMKMKICCVLDFHFSVMFHSVFNVHYYCLFGSYQNSSRYLYTHFVGRNSQWYQNIPKIYTSRTVQCEKSCFTHRNQMLPYNIHVICLAWNEQ